MAVQGRTYGLVAMKLILYGFAFFLATVQHGSDYQHGGQASAGVVAIPGIGLLQRFLRPARRILFLPVPAIERLYGHLINRW